MDCYSIVDDLAIQVHFPLQANFQRLGRILLSEKKKQKHRSQNLLPHHLPKNAKYYILIHTHTLNKKETELSSLSRVF